MAGGNGGFYKEQTIDPGGGLRLSGPLELEKDWTLSKMYIWLWQVDGDGTGAAVTAVLDESDLVSAAAQNGGGAEWRTIARPENRAFPLGSESGVAIALLTRGGGSTAPYQWCGSNSRLPAEGGRYLPDPHNA